VEGRQPASTEEMTQLFARTRLLERTQAD
jgi:hypothetical protein